MGTRLEHSISPLAHVEQEPDPDQLEGGLDDPEQLDVDELEDDDGWADEEEED
jgi:hypothetical protein